jgi:putative Mn2+ efflux pump MntP
VNIAEAAAIISCTIFAISLGGVFAGNYFGIKYKSKAEFAGGVILILIGYS